MFRMGDAKHWASKIADGFPNSIKCLGGVPFKLSFDGGSGTAKTIQLAFHLSSIEEDARSIM